MKTILKIAGIILIIAGVAGVAAAAEAPRASSAGPVLRSVTFPSGKIYRLGNPFPIHLSIESPDAPFEGRIEISVGPRVYYKKCSLPAGGFECVHIDVIFTDDMGEFSARAVAKNSVIAFDKSQVQQGALRGVGAGVLLVCVTPAPPSGDVASLFEERPWVLAPMSEAEFPDEIADYGPFFLIVIGEARPEEIKAEARAALMEKIRFGCSMFLPEGAKSAEWIFPGKKLEFADIGPLVEARFGLGRVFAPREGVNFRMLPYDEQAEIKSKMLEIMASSGNGYALPGPVASVSRAASSLFEAPERNPGGMRYAAALLALQFLLILIFTLAKKRFALFSFGAAAVLSAAMYFIVPAPGTSEVESFDIVLSKAGAPESVNIEMSGISRLVKTPVADNENEIALPDSDFLIPIAADYNALLEMSGESEAGDISAIRGFALDAYKPLTAASVNYETEPVRIEIRRTGGGALEISNFAGVDLEGCMVTDFKTASVLGALKLGKTAAVPPGRPIQFTEAAQKSAEANTRAGRIFLGAFKYVSEIKSQANSSEYFIAFAPPVSGTERNSGVKRASCGRLIIMELPRD